MSAPQTPSAARLPDHELIRGALDILENYKTYKGDPPFRSWDGADNVPHIVAAVATLFERFPDTRPEVLAAAMASPTVYRTESFKSLRSKLGDRVAALIEEAEGNFEKDSFDSATRESMILIIADGLAFSAVAGTGKVPEAAITGCIRGAELVRKAVATNHPDLLDLAQDVCDRFRNAAPKPAVPAPGGNTPETPRP